MQFGRTLLTFLVAASVAMLPVVGGVAAPAAAKSMDMSASMAMPVSVDMSVSEAMSDCCPPEAVPCDQGMSTCADMAACAFSVLSFSGSAVSALVFPPVGAQVPQPLAHQTLRSHTGSPPFRPPRV